MEDFIKGLDFNVIYSHNDLHAKNLVYDKTTGELLLYWIIREYADGKLPFKKNLLAITIWTC